MIKKSVCCVCLILICSIGLFSIEVGVNAGSISNPNHTTYGLSSAMGFLVPMIKFEVEYYKISGIKAPTGSTAPIEFPNSLTGGVKLRPRLGAFAPYVVVGVGAEFEHFDFHFSQYKKFSFVGGGVHFFVTGMISLRGDVRLLHFHGYNRTRYTAGVFLHI